MIPLFANPSFVEVIAMRHALLLASAFLALVAFAATPAGATPSLSIGSVAATPGTPKDLPITLVNGASVVALQFDVAFDGTKADGGVAHAGPALTTTHEVSSSLQNAGTVNARVSVVVLSQSNVDEVIPEGVIVLVPLTLHVGVMGDVAATLADVEMVTAPDSLACSDFSGSTPCPKTGGTVTVAATCVVGDLFAAVPAGQPPAPACTGDGAVTLADFVVARREVLKAPASRCPRDVTCGNLAPGHIACASLTAPNPPSNFCHDPEPDGTPAAFNTQDVVLIRRLVARTIRLSCLACGAEAAAPSPAFTPGDAAPRQAPDGRLDIADVVVALRDSVGLDVPAHDELLRLDVAPATRSAGVASAQGNAVIDISDVVLLLRGAVGLERIEWPERSLAVRLQSPTPHVAFAVRVGGWPAWAEVLGARASECGADDDAGLDTSREFVAVTCAGDGTRQAGPMDLAVIRYRGPSVDPSRLSLASELINEQLSTVTANVELATP